jgi:Cytochrome P450
MTRTIADLPGPPRLPLLGNAHQLARTSRLHLTAEGWARRYGPIVRVSIGKRRIVGISDASEIHRILRERPDGYRRWSEQEIVVREMGSEGLLPPGVFVAEGDTWKRQRRLVITALNTNHLNRYFDVVRTTTERLYRRLTDAARSGRVLDISDELTSYTLDTISWLAFGHDLNTLEHHEVELQGHIQRIFQMTARRLAAPVPYWRWVRLPSDRALDRSIVELRGAVRAFLEQARERIARRPELREAPENLLEAMLAAQQADGSPTDEETVVRTPRSRRGAGMPRPTLLWRPRLSSRMRPKIVTQSTRTTSRSTNAASNTSRAANRTSWRANWVRDPATARSKSRPRSRACLRTPRPPTACWPASMACSRAPKSASRPRRSPRRRSKRKAPAPSARARRRCMRASIPAGRL